MTNPSKLHSIKKNKKKNGTSTDYGIQIFMHDNPLICIRWLELRDFFVILMQIESMTVLTFNFLNNVYPNLVVQVS